MNTILHDDELESARKLAWQLYDTGVDARIIQDMGYVKNITSPLAQASSGRTKSTFTPDPNQNFNHEFTDYFVQGSQHDIGAYDSPKNPG